MPCLWGQHNNSQVFLDVAILDASVALPPHGQTLAAGNAIHPRMFRSLVDTGAQKTMISTNVALQLNLSPVGKIAIRGVGPSITYHLSYLFYVGFVISVGYPGQYNIPGSQVQVFAHILPTPISGAELAPTSGFDVLLGMDVLSTGSLKVEGNGSFSFSF